MFLILFVTLVFGYFVSIVCDHLRAACGWFCCDRCGASCNPHCSDVLACVYIISLKGWTTAWNILSFISTLPSTVP